MLSQPAVSATHVAFTYAGDLWSAKLDGSDVIRLTTRGRRRIVSGVFAGRKRDRLLGELRWQCGRLRRAGGWRRSASTHLPPRSRCSAGVHTGRPSGALRIGTQRNDNATIAAVHGPRRGGRRGGAADPDGRAGDVCPRRSADRLQSSAPGLRGMEALPRWTQLGDPSVYEPDPCHREDSAARDTQ